MKRISWLFGALVVAACAMNDKAAVPAAPVPVYAAGSLREALTAICKRTRGAELADACG